MSFIRVVEMDGTFKLVSEKAGFDTPCSLRHESKDGKPLSPKPKATSPLAHSTAMQAPPVNTAELDMIVDQLLSDYRLKQQEKSKPQDEVMPQEKTAQQEQPIQEEKTMQQDPPMEQEKPKQEERPKPQLRDPRAYEADEDEDEDEDPNDYTVQFTESRLAEEAKNAEKKKVSRVI